MIESPPIELIARKIGLAHLEFNRMVVDFPAGFDLVVIRPQWCGIHVLVGNGLKEKPRRPPFIGMPSLKQTCGRI